MAHQSEVTSLISGLDISLQQLELCAADRQDGLIRPILVRRRRARIMLRSLAEGQVTAPPNPKLTRFQSMKSLFSLWRMERGLIELYDKALAVAAPGSLARQILSKQRAEAYQAFLVISDALRGSNDPQQHA